MEHLISDERSKSDTPARVAGALLVITAAATVVAVYARVAADADQPTLLESLQAIEDKRWMYGTTAAARFVSGMTLLAAAWYLSRTWIIRERLGTPLVPYLLGLSGIFTAISGACAGVLTAYQLPETAAAGGIAAFEAPGALEATATLRWLAGKIGFALAGIALLVAARYQWRVGGTLRGIAPASAVIGIAMQLIWIDAVTIVHRFSGVAFVLWLVAVGTMLFTGRVERHFTAKYGGRPSASQGGD